MTETLDLGELEVDEFEALWSIFRPRRDRRRAEGAFRRARKVASFEEIMNAARAYSIEVENVPTDRLRSAVDWLRAEPWKPEAPPVAPRPAPRTRRRRPNSPVRRPHGVTRVSDPALRESARDRWCRRHGITADEYEARKGDAEWLERIKRRGIVA